MGAVHVHAPAETCPVLTQLYLSSVRQGVLISRAPPCRGHRCPRTCGPGPGHWPGLTAGGHYGHTAHAGSPRWTPARTPVTASLGTATAVRSVRGRSAERAARAQTKLALPTLAKLIHSNDEEVLTDACWALSYLSDGTNDKIQEVIQAGVCRRLVELLLCAALRCAAGARGRVRGGPTCPAAPVTRCRRSFRPACAPAWTSGCCARPCAARPG